MIMWVLLISTPAFSEPTTTSTIPTVDDSEAFKYENEYLAEHESLKKSFSDKAVIKWIQPSNKKENCKVYVGVDPSNDRTVDDSYKIFWDGSCKDGYAYGLGREFERGMILNMDALAVYKEKKEEPQYFIEKHNLDNETKEGDINNGYFVSTKIEEDIADFDIVYTFGFHGSPTQPFGLYTVKSMFSDDIFYIKQYINFQYQIYDSSNNEFEQNTFYFRMLNKNDIENGFSTVLTKDGNTNSGEVSNGELKGPVNLPESYFNKIRQIHNEITQASQKAMDAQKEAIRVKKQYMSKICKDSVRVTFIDNSEYKAICNENENSNLKKKIENKFTQVNFQKQQKREQQNQQKIVDAQVAHTEAEQRQTAAAARSAAAAEQANNKRQREQQEYQQKREQQEYQRQREQRELAEFRQGLNDLSNQLQRQNEQSNYNMQQFMNRNNVYKFKAVGPYGY